MRLSYSAISTYLTCPLQYRFQYVEGRPGLPSPALSFGSSVHAALEWLYSVPTPHPATLDEHLEYLEKCWVSEGFESPEEEARYYFQARSTLELYYRNNITGGAEGFKLPVALEHKFVVDLGFCDLSGVIDRLDRDATGAFEITDYKTNRRLPPARRLREDLQLPLYQVAAKKIWDVPVSRVTFHYLLMDHKASFVITPEREDEALHTVKSVAGRIEAGDFEPCKNNLCPWCDYAGDCPLYAARPLERKRAAAPALEVGQAVDELISERDRAASCLRRIEGLERIVTAYLEGKGVASVGGTRGSATLDESGAIVCEVEDQRLF